MAVVATGELTFGAPHEVRGELGGPLVAGLPDEFAQPVLATLSDMLTGWDRGAGTLAVGSAAYDETNSSPLAFRAAAELLAAAIAAGREGRAITEDQVARVITGW